MKNVIIILSVLISNIYGQDLFFSEYIEGSSSNKALEIYNPTDAPINLRDYYICDDEDYYTIQTEV